MAPEKRLIDAHALKKAFRTDEGAEVIGHSTRKLFRMDSIVDAQPTVDAAEVVWTLTQKGHALAAAREAGLIDDLNDPRFERFWRAFSEAVDCKTEPKGREKAHGKNE